MTNPTASISNKNINRLAIPAILSGIAEPLISLADTAFVGKLGTEQLAAIGIASSFYLMLVWVLSQSLTAISAIVSQHLGAGKVKRISTLVPQALLANIILGLAVFLFTGPFSDAIFTFYKASGNVLDYCKEYYAIRSLGFPFTLGTMLLFGTFRGLQNTAWAMRIAISGAALNIILDALLVHGVNGFIPSYGVAGAAWASLSSQVLMFVLAIYTLLKKTPFNLFPGKQLNHAFRWLANMSSDLFIRTLLLNVTFYLAIRYATGYGPAQIAAHTIAMNIWLFSSFFIDGYALAGNAISGQLKGGDNHALIHKLGVQLMKISILIGAGLGTCYLISYPVMANAFTHDTEVVHWFNRIFWIVALSQPINSIAFLLDGVYKGLAETKLLRNLLIGATLLGFVPALLAMDYFLPNLLGIWIAICVWMTIRAAYLLFDFRKFKTT